ncbi:hypothetical protein MMC11_007223, partial [Xylographa trunciseda]|nr:hypothetical protein [Xylographa trunciseda]
MSRAEQSSEITRRKTWGRKPEEASKSCYGSYQVTPSELLGSAIQTKIDQTCYDKVLAELPGTELIKRTRKRSANVQPGSYNQCSEIESGRFNHNSLQTTIGHLQIYGNLSELPADSAPFFDYENATKGSQEFAPSQYQDTAFRQPGNEHLVAGPWSSCWTTNQPIHDDQSMNELHDDGTDKRNSIDHTQDKIGGLFSESELRSPFLALDEFKERSLGTAQTDSGSKQSLRKNLYDAGHRLWKINVSQPSSDTVMSGSPLRSAFNPQLRWVESVEPDLASSPLQRAGDFRFRTEGSLESDDHTMARN